MSTAVIQTQTEPLELASLPPTSRHAEDGRTSGIEEPPAVIPSDDVPPPNAQSRTERWNYPKGNVGKLVFTFLSSIIAGMNDSAVGALIPSLEAYYDISYTIISLIFLTPFAGYSIAAFTNAWIHMKFGQRGVAIMAPICHIITFVALALHPPYPVLVVCNMISGFGNGLTDACFCAWIGAMDKANTIQGFLHSCYSLGALFAPLIATSMVVSAELPWYTYYYVMIGISVVEWIGLTVTFWHKTGAAYRAEHELGPEVLGAGTREALKSKVTWLCALFFFAYMGVEVGLGGWVVTFMLRVRKATRLASGASASGFWAGMTLGRAVLGFVTERFGERLCISIYLAISIGLELLFWLVPQFIVSAVAVAFLGFFLGPLFPGAVMLTAKLLPAKLHVSAIGFAMAMGGTGGTVFPFAIGAIANSKGVRVLQPIVLALIAVVALVWLSFPRIQKKN
ncbi:MFS domain-containing protein [Fusarium keratoplasticum]|uniref:MFS domain-containing protein n=1 Tax=Fusarium keratoplasticum TaxID=1328300 RepID=A0ACC0QEC8_9HYPO|nr:MFS domain-containing protein [Fusarium keratoplasticum]KAI8652232.1 MFS domain-containing protein [Fusarium keratoplasticum]KAI8652974.1 MFS domain-containing protein [Fusarium keratoplasticum]